MRNTEIAIASPFKGAPKINIAAVYGASPRKELILRIPVTGERPISYVVKGLAEGLVHKDGVIRGRIEREGRYSATLIAENSLGRDEKEIVFEIKEGATLLTPLMGFTSWNAFGPDVSQEKLEGIAEKMLELGLTEYGYSYVNIDSGWQGEYGGEFDAIMPNYKFPDMKGFTDRLHSEGLKCGIYSAPTVRSFGCPRELESLPGTTSGEPEIIYSEINGGVGKIRKEKNNALQWAAWGFDYLKYDWTPTDTYNAEMMRQALASTDRDFGLSITTRANPAYHSYWMNYCNSVRNNTDSLCKWDNLVETYNSYFPYMSYVNKGHFFDLDMLDTGTCRMFEYYGLDKEAGFGLTEDEQIVAYSMRAFLCSPIQISSSLENITEFELSLYCNEEIIGINQDSPFSAAKPYMILEDGRKKIHVLKKRLSDGTAAYAAFNFGETEENLEIFLEETKAVRDLWAKCDIGTTDTIRFRSFPHTVRIFK